MVDTIQDKVQQSVELLTESQQYLSSDIYLETVETFPMNVQTVLTEVVETLRPQAEERSIRWEITQSQLMSAVLASPAKIEQVVSVILMVLLRDTIDRTAIAVEGVENENGIIYAFSNSGFGMPNDHFQEYLSGNGHEAAVELKGLHEAIEWVKEWGGTLECQRRNLSHSSTAPVCLTRHREPDEKPMGKKILIVFDDEILRKVLTLGLKNAGYEPITAANGEEAIPLVQQEKPDIILADLHIPVMDGLRFLRWVRGEAAMTTPVVIFTRSVQADILREAKEAGATFILRKPVKTAKLLETLASLG